jgi:hypothetical protein
MSAVFMPYVIEIGALFPATHLVDNFLYITIVCTCMYPKEARGFCVVCGHVSGLLFAIPPLVKNSEGFGQTV